MRKYRSDELRRFLRAVDAHLTAPFRLVLVGGSAAQLGYGIDRKTQDIDTWDDAPSRIADALELARKETGLAIPVQRPYILDGPAHLEDRMRTARIRGLKNLTVLVPDKHDLVLMKMLRGEQQDVETAQQINEKRGLESEILIRRYLYEMGHVVRDVPQVDRNLVTLLGRLYGADAAAMAGRRLEVHRES